MATENRATGVIDSMINCNAQSIVVINRANRRKYNSYMKP